MIELTELQQLWQKLLGLVPVDEQWTLWLAMHAESVVGRGILQTAKKNIALNQIMDFDYKVRFASKVMLEATAREEENAARREKLQERFGVR